MRNVLKTYLLPLQVIALVLTLVLVHHGFVEKPIDVAALLENAKAASLHSFSHTLITRLEQRKLRLQEFQHEPIHFGSFRGEIRRQKDIQPGHAASPTLSLYKLSLWQEQSFVEPKQKDKSATITLWVVDTRPEHQVGRLRWVEWQIENLPRNL